MKLGTPDQYAFVTTAYTTHNTELTIIRTGVNNDNPRIASASFLFDQVVRI